MGSVRGVPGVAAGTPWSILGLWAGAALLALHPRHRRWSAAATGAAALVTSFFRDPHREAPPTGLLAAADGIVSAVDERSDGRVRVATYMRLQDVHVNRAPVDLVVRAVERRPGGFRPAWSKDSERNERIVWTVDTPLGAMELAQIAGILTHRIVAYHHAGEQVDRGARIGLIRFGSRVDVVLPAGVRPAVRVGDRMRAGRTRLDRP